MINSPLCSLSSTPACPLDQSLHTFPNTSSSCVSAVHQQPSCRPPRISQRTHANLPSSTPPRRTSLCSLASHLTTDTNIQRSKFNSIGFRRSTFIYATTTHPLTQYPCLHPSIHSSDLSNIS
ncbi:hypothetical protein TcWFU_004733 [Taenia crassiceps]|uniref:Uncharacterized protein n=1 Tax=Taenia crassiceps TaxID=6207 RepID=A0ABR4QDA7_9CEST